MKLYVARHGKTKWNEQNKICGLTDVSLSNEGIKQANKLAIEVSKKKIDLIISSPLKRAIDTSTIISNYCSIPINIDDRLIEQNYGIFEGTTRNNKEFLEYKKNFAYKYPSGESMMQVAHRVYGFLNDINDKYNNKNILIISHGGVCRIIHTYFNDMTNEEFCNYTLENAIIKEYNFK